MKNNYGLLWFTCALILQGCGGSNDQQTTNTETKQTASAMTSSTASPSEESHSLTSSVSTSSSNTTAVTDNRLLKALAEYNQAAYVPAQCYTKTEDESGKIHNPCYTCHQDSVAPNFINDGDFQVAFSFRPYTRTNRWSNLFKDRSEKVAAISDEAILSYIRQSNYFDSERNIVLADTLNEVPANWDFNGNNTWDGYIPDCYFNFDAQGFDRDTQNKDTGWRVFAYTPFPGTFWPTNGSTDDVLIRLPETMQQDAAGQYSRNVYKLNLAIVETMVKRKNTHIEPTNENDYGVDLNKNGVLDTAESIVYDWAPRENRYMSYVGQAKALQDVGQLHIAGGLYPEGTEFLHTVRYIDLDDNNKVKMAARIKELRYATKHSWNTYSQMNNAALSEIKESEQFPERLRTIRGNPETGLYNSLGWTYQGFIEDANGDLRPQSFEESMNCIGCHSGIGATTDSSFAFPRKLADSKNNSAWYHWTQKDITGISEPRLADGTYEYTEYLQQNQSGNEFRTNEEVISRFFDAFGELKAEAVKQLHSDISFLLLPSPERALEHNKAYKIIVDEQSYIYGRDAHVKPLNNVWQRVSEGQLTGVGEPVSH